MSWNYRICVRTLGTNVPGVEPQEYYGVHEVYYDKAGKPNGCTKEEVTVGSDSVEGIRFVLDGMRKALDRPVLDYETLNEIDRK